MRVLCHGVCARWELRGGVGGGGGQASSGAYAGMSGGACGQVAPVHCVWRWLPCTPHNLTARRLLLGAAGGEFFSHLKARGKLGEDAARLYAGEVG